MDILLAKLYQVFEEKKTVFTNAGLEPVKTMDIYRGQTLNPEQFEIYEIPALFFDYRIDWEKAGKKYQGTGTLDIHVVTDLPWETSSVFTGYEEGLKKTFYYKYVRTILDDIESENTSKLTRLTERPVDTGVISYHMLSYNFTYYDQGNSNLTTLVTDATPIVNGNLVKHLKTTES